jgi:hypothetical protein
MYDTQIAKEQLKMDSLYKDFTNQFKINILLEDGTLINEEVVYDGIYYNHYKNLVIFSSLFIISKN